MTECFDVLNEDGTLTGQVLSRDEVHAQGLWHGSVHVWVANSAGQLLLQQRAHTKKTDAELWDISVCGHIAAGDTAIPTALREAEEELGLTLDPAAFDHLYVYTRTNEHPLTDGSIRYERLISPTYLARADVELDSLRLEPTEVAAVRWIGLPDLASNIEREHATPETLLTTYAIRPDEWADLYPLLQNRLG